MMRKLTLIEWQLIPWSHKGFAGSGIRTYIIVCGERVEVQVVDKDGTRISHVGYSEEYFEDVQSKT